ncbi:MAG: 2TM domain-containing protein [Candidatus Hydrogenedentes bacterium]|nr:2TM domain-containing protein [Candidatus Hydrogenedentota bacterium]
MADRETEEMYTVEEVESILRRALKRRRDNGEITYAELAETARELGISNGELEYAIREQAQRGSYEAACEEWKARRKRKFYEHLRAYLIVNGFLFLLDIFVSGGAWFYYCLLGWGIGLAFDASSAFNPNPAEVERGARKILRKQAMGAHRSSECEFGGPWRTANR